MKHHRLFIGLAVRSSSRSHKGKRTEVRTNDIRVALLSLGRGCILLFTLAFGGNVSSSLFGNLLLLVGCTKNLDGDYSLLFRLLKKVSKKYARLFIRPILKHSLLPRGFDLLIYMRSAGCAHHYSILPSI